MKKYPKVRRPGHDTVTGLFQAEDDPLIITEKFDGNNFRFTRTEDSLRFGSRNQELGSDPTTVGNMFKDVAAYIDDQIDPTDIEAVEDKWHTTSVTLFGENAVQHTIDEYDWTEVPQFQLFDVWVEFHEDEEQRGTWLTWGEVETVADMLGLETVPVIEKTTVDEFAIDEFEVPPSTFRPDDGPAEGVVLRNARTKQKAKYISDEFAERHKSAKQGNLVDPDDDVQKFIDKHVSKQRIEKNIAKLLEEPGNGHDGLGMEIMEDLHLKVWRDVWAEDYEEIIATDWIIDMKRAHNKTANKAANHVREFLQSGETPVAVVDTETGETVDPDRINGGDE